MSPKLFHTLTGKKYPLPLFFPDATRAFVKSLDSLDIVSTHTLGVLVNTLHLLTSPGLSVIKNFKGVSNYMNWTGATISDSGGFQVMSLAKKFGGIKAVSDKGVIFQLPNQKKSLFTPEISIKLQLSLKTDLCVVLDDFTEPGASRSRAKETVDRTILWAKLCRQIFDTECKKQKISKKPYLIGVAQGGDYLDLRADCTKQLVEIGFDGIGYGGWPMKDGKFNYDIADVIKKNTPDNYLLYGLGVGKPDEVVNLSQSSWHIFDCVLPTRDARHKRLYVFNTDNINDIDISKPKFYSYYTPDKEIYYRDKRPISPACDCLLCQNYSRSYLAHLFRVGDSVAGRLATIHNLRFYSLLMEKIRHEK